MGPNDIFEAMWAMPWYQVLYVALWDDVILFCKVWYIWLGFIVVCTAGAAFLNRGK